MKLISDLDKVCVAKTREAGQGHLFDGWESLAPEDQQSLIAQVEGIDFQLFRRLVQQHIHTVAGPLERRVLKPAPLTALPRPETEREEYEFCKNLADYALRNGEVLFVTAAGGGGLGPFGEPVGMLPVGPVSGKSVFQLFAEKILALNKRHRISIRWHIFCHPTERDAVAEFFKSRGFFGLKSSFVTFVSQGLLPVVNRRGKILLSAPGRLAMSPSGHGSILLYFLHEERLQTLENWGIRHIFYHQVDNPLVQVGDPAFLGLHIKTRSEVSSKAVRKTAPEESVGVFCQYNDSVGVVEYMELSDEDREGRLPDGSLAFSAANIGVHLLSVEFLRRMRTEGLQLPFHAVEQATAFLNRRGLVVRPTETNSIGFRAFVFDALPLARRTLVTEVERQEEFSPIKRATGASSPETAKRDLSRLYTHWIIGALQTQAESAREDAGGSAGEGAVAEGEAAGEAESRRERLLVVRDQLRTGAGRAVEVSPLFALDQEDLKRKALAEIPAAGDILLGGGN